MTKLKPGLLETILNPSLSAFGYIGALMLTVPVVSNIGNHVVIFWLLALLILVSVGTYFALQSSEQEQKATMLTWGGTGVVMLAVCAITLTTLDESLQAKIAIGFLLMVCIFGVSRLVVLQTREV